MRNHMTNVPAVLGAPQPFKPPRQSRGAATLVPISARLINFFPPPSRIPEFLLTHAFSITNLYEFQSPDEFPAVLAAPATQHN